MVDNKRKQLNAQRSKTVNAVPLTIHEMRLSPVPVVALAQAHDIRRQIDLESVRLVQLARTDGSSWSDIGGALGVSAQAAQQRFGGRPRDREADGSWNPRAAAATYGV